MALGGGTYISQNKVLPGSYINFISASRSAPSLSERGVLAVALEDIFWGPEGEVFSVTAGEFEKNSLRYFGYPYTAKELMPLREMFSNIRMGHFYRLDTGGNKAACELCKAKYSGERGNEITVVVANSEEAKDEAPLFDVLVYFAGVLVEEFMGVSKMDELPDSNYVLWDRGMSLGLTPGSCLGGGTDGMIIHGSDQKFLDKIEKYSFNILARATTDDDLKGLYANFTRRMREDCGVKFQCVLYRYPGDYEGVISVENSLEAERGYSEDSEDSAALVYWAAGAQAGCEVNSTLTNSVYNGELLADTDYTQIQLEEAIKSGKFILHKVGDSVRVLEDINTLTEYSQTKGEDFSMNQTVRVLDQIGNDIADIFNRRYLGKIPNDAAGRVSLWNDIVSHHKQLQSIRAIEDFQPDRLSVERGDTKKSVVVTDYVTPTNAMSQLYMAVIVE